MIKEEINIGFSTLLNTDIVKDVDFAIKNKFNVLSVELSWKPNMDYSTEEVSALNKFSSQGGIIILHAPFFLVTNSSINELASGVINYLNRVLKFAKDINAKSITLHGGYNEQIEIVRTNKYLLKNLKDILSIAKKQRISLSIENDDKDSNYPLWKLEEVMEILKKVKGINFTYDPGHANTTDINVYDFLDKTKDYINIIHLHNNYGKDSHNSLNEGTINYKHLFQQFIEKCNPKTIYILELFPYERILKNRDLVLEYLNK